MTTEMPIQMEGSNVSGLMQVNRTQWDEDVLMDICNKMDMSLIRKIPLPMREQNDSWFWLLDD